MTISSPCTSLCAGTMPHCCSCCCTGHACGNGERTEALCSCSCVAQVSILSLLALCQLFAASQALPCQRPHQHKHPAVAATAVAAAAAAATSEV